MILFILWAVILAVVITVDALTLSVGNRGIDRRVGSRDLGHLVGRLPGPIPEGGTMRVIWSILVGIVWVVAVSNVAGFLTEAHSVSVAVGVSGILVWLIGTILVAFHIARAISDREDD